MYTLPFQQTHGPAIDARYNLLRFLCYSLIYKLILQIMIDIENRIKFVNMCGPKVWRRIGGKYQNQKRHPL